jgi:hypothetical protein
MSAVRSLSGVKRTLRGHRQTVAFDPLRTLALKTYFILTVPDAFQVSSFGSYIAAFNR